MLQDIKNIIKQSAVYGLSRTTTKLIGLILLPIYSTYFSMNDYGIIVRVETLWQILWSVYLFGLESGVVRWYNLLSEDDRKKKFVFTVLLFLLITNLIYTIGIYVFSTQLSGLILENIVYNKLIFYASLIASFETLSFIVFLLIRIKEKPLMYTIFSFLGTIINFGIQYYFIVYTNTKLEGVFIAKVFSPLILIIVLLPFLIKFIKIGIEYKSIKELIIYSFPAMLSSLVSMLLIQIDRYTLGYLTDSREVGIYGLAFNICGVLNFAIISPYSLAFIVYGWKKLSDENAKRFFTKNVTYLFILVLYFSVILSLITPLLIVFLNNKDYWYAKDLVPYIGMAMPFYGISIIGCFSFYVSKNTKKILYVFLIALSVKIATNFIFIPFLKMYGAAISNFISYLSLGLSVYLFSKNEYFFKYEWLKMFNVLLTAICITFPFFIINIAPEILNILLRFVAIAIFPAILYKLKVYESIELETVKKFVRKYYKIK